MKISEVLDTKRPQTIDVPVRRIPTDPESTVVFRFSAIGRDAFEALKAEHPPLKEHRMKLRKALQSSGMNAAQIDFQVSMLLKHNPDTFPAALIAASVDPSPSENDPDELELVETMTVEEAQAMWDSEVFSQAELAKLLMAAESVNTIGAEVPDQGNE